MSRRIVIIIATLAATPAFSQPPGPPGGGGERRGGMMAMFANTSPDELFDRFAKGKNVLHRNDLDPMGQMMFDRFARQMGVTNDQVTREQFKQGFEQMQQRMQNGGGGPGGFGGPPSPEAMDRFFENQFRRFDKNGDGLLQPDEMPEALLAERDKWDTNKDGFIDLAEYKAYARARMETMRGNRGEAPVNALTTAFQDNANATVPAGVVEPAPEVSRPIVLRAGKLPKELPAWFTQLDTDQDGQVGLYEWVKGGKPISEFRDMDTNDDGFLTPEEVLRFLNGGKSFNYNLTMSDSNSPAYKMRSSSDGNPRNGDNNRRGSWPSFGGGGRNWSGGGSNGNGNGNGNDRRGPGGRRPGGDRPDTGNRQ